MVDLLALTERVVAGPDREVDSIIHYDVLGWCRHANTVRSGAQSDTGFDCIDCGADSWGNKSKRGQKLYDNVPRYTDSIDAAMLLLPTDHSMTLVDLTIGWEQNDPEVWPAATLRWYPPYASGPNWHAQISTAATAALAICHAALTARARLTPPSATESNAEDRG